MFFVSGGTWWRWLVTLVTHLEVFLHNMSRWTLPHFARLNVGLNVLGGHKQFFFFFFYISTAATTEEGLRWPPSVPDCRLNENILPWGRRTGQPPPTCRMSRRTNAAGRTFTFEPKPCRNHLSAGRTRCSGFFLFTFTPSARSAAVFTVNICLQLLRCRIQSAVIMTLAPSVSLHSITSHCSTVNHDVALNAQSDRCIC